MKAIIRISCRKLLAEPQMPVQFELDVIGDSYKMIGGQILFRKTQLERIDQVMNVWGNDFQHKLLEEDLKVRTCST